MRRYFYKESHLFQRCGSAGTADASDAHQGQASEVSFQLFSQKLSRAPAVPLGSQARPTRGHEAASMLAASTYAKAHAQASNLGSGPTHHDLCGVRVAVPALSVACPAVPCVVGVPRVPHLTSANAEATTKRARSPKEPAHVRSKCVRGLGLCPLVGWTADQLCPACLG